MVDSKKEEVDQGCFRPNLVRIRHMVIVVSDERESHGSQLFLVRSAKEETKGRSGFWWSTMIGDRGLVVMVLVTE